MRLSNSPRRGFGPSVAFGLGLAVAALAAGCTSPRHLTYDHGRAYTEAFTAQADLTRASVASSNYQLYGVEAADIRLRVREESTDTETEESVLTSGN